MRKKLQDIMFEISYLFDLVISVVVGVAIVIAAVRLILDISSLDLLFDNNGTLMTILDDAIILAIGAEFIKMLCKHTPETVIEVIAFALAHHLIVGHAAPLDNFITVLAIATLFAVRKFLLKHHDMVETPDGLIENDNHENK